MQFSDSLRSELAYLYKKSSSEVSAFEETLERTDLSAKEVLRAHFCIAEHFTAAGNGLGGIGVKDTNMLISALSRQHVGFGVNTKWNTVHEKAATLLFGMIKNHPFYDADKRTAYLSTIHYLYSNGFILTVTERELEDLTVLVANNGLSKFRRYKELRKKADDPEVRYIAHYLKQNTRMVDRKQYLLTYRELSNILKPYDVWLENPHNNQIDVMHWEDVEVPRRTVFHKKKTTKEIRRGCVLGFPGWTKTVGHGRLKHLRKQLKLTPEDGVDSQSFFRGVDDMRVLLDLYEGALMRLADR